MGFFGSGDKIQTDLTTQVGASEEAQLNYGQGGSVVGGGDVANASVISTGGVLGLSQSNISGGVTISDMGAFDLARDYMSNYSETLSEMLAKQTQAGTATNSMVEGLVTKFGELIESKNTEGESSRNNTMLYIALAIAAVFGIFFWRKSRS